MLKVFHTFCDHEIPAHPDAVEALRQVQSRLGDFGDAFALLKDRIESVFMQIQVQEL